MIARENQHTAIVEFALDELHEAITGKWTDKRNADHFANSVARKDQDMPDRAEWYGGLRSVKQAADILTAGWREGATRLQHAANEVEAPASRSRKRRPEWRDEGDELSIDRAMRGEWDNAWRSSRRVWTAGPSHVTVYASFGGNANRDSDALFWSGAAALIVTDRLEQAGYTVRLVGSVPTKSSEWTEKRALRTDVVIKDSDEPLRTDALAAVLCHAGIFRTFGFAAICALPGNVGSGLGKQASFADHKGAYERAGEWPEGSVILESAFTREGCIQVIKGALSQIGGES